MGGIDTLYSRRFNVKTKVNLHAIVNIVVHKFQKRKNCSGEIDFDY